MTFFRLSKMSLPSSTPVTIELKLSSSKICKIEDSSNAVLPILFLAYQVWDGKSCKFQFLCPIGDFTTIKTVKIYVFLNVFSNKYCKYFILKPCQQLLWRRQSRWYPSRFQCWTSLRPVSHWRRRRSLPRRHLFAEKETEQWQKVESSTVSYNKLDVPSSVNWQKNPNQRLNLPCNWRIS